MQIQIVALTPAGITHGKLHLENTIYLLGIAYSTSGVNFLSVIGNAFDIAGAILLARSLVLVRANEMLNQSASGYGGGSLSLLKMFAEQKVDGEFGLGLLVAGFAIQGAAGLGLKSTAPHVLAVGVAALLVLLVAYFMTRRQRAKMLFEKACRTQLQPDGSRLWTDEEIEGNWAEL